MWSEAPVSIIQQYVVNLLENREYLGIPCLAEDTFGLGLAVALDLITLFWLNNCCNTSN